MGEPADDVDVLIDKFKARSARGALTFVMYADIDARPRKNWLVTNFLGANELSCLFGAPSSGKSVLASDLAGHIAAGRAWFGRAVTKGAVLYIAAERANLVNRRFAAFRLHHGLDDLPIAVVSGSVDLRTSRADANAIIEHADHLQRLVGLPVALVIIDTIGISATDTTERARQAAFKRASEYLIGDQHVSVWHGQAWPTSTSK